MTILTKVPVKLSCLHHLINKILISHANPLGTSSLLSSQKSIAIFQMSLDLVLGNLVLHTENLGIIPITLIKIFKPNLDGN